MQKSLQVMLMWLPLRIIASAPCLGFACLLILITTPAAANIDAEAVTITNVQSQGIAPLSLDTVGFQDSVLSESLWRDSKQQQIKYLLDNISINQHSEALKNLYVRLLNAKTIHAPIKSDDDEGLLDLRIKILSRLQASNRVLDLTELIPSSMKTSDIHLIQRYHQLVLNQTEEACPPIKQQLTTDVSLWNYLWLTCQLQQQEWDKANLTASLIRGHGHIDNAPLHQQIDQLPELVSQSDQQKEQYIASLLLLLHQELPPLNPEQAKVTKSPLSLDKALIEIVSESYEAKQQPINPETVTQWWERHRDADSQLKADYMERLLLVLESHSVRVDEGFWQPLYPYLQNQSIVQRRLEQAVAEDQTGEVILLSLILFNQQHPSNVENHVLQSIMRALAAIGLTEEVNHIAQESLTLL